MDRTRPERLRIARLPTPVERLARFEQRWPDYELWIKRDDLTEFGLSGNKIRKLEYHFAAAMENSATSVVTCGGWNSNHCRATALLAARLGLRAHLFLRTADGLRPDSRSGNLLLDEIAGADCHWITPEQYRSRDSLMVTFTEDRRGSGEVVHPIPEGASDAIGALGFVDAVAELNEQCRESDHEFDVVVHAIGSGGTTAGLATGRCVHGAGWDLLAVSVGDPRTVFEARVREIRTELTEYGLPEPQADPWLEIDDRHVGSGYGIARPEELVIQRDFVRREGILLDPTYTGKALVGLQARLDARCFPKGTKILFWHTGGAFGNFAFESEWSAILGDEGSSDR